MSFALRQHHCIIRSRIFIASGNISKKQLELNYKYAFHHLVSNYLNGAVNDNFVMIKLMVQVIAVLVTGLVLWRVSAVFTKKKSEQRRRNVFMGSRYQDQWKNKK